MRSKLILSQDNYFELPLLDIKSNFIIDEHRDLAAIDFWSKHHDQDGNLVPPTRLTGPSIYKALLRDHFLEEAKSQINKKVHHYLTSITPCSPLNFTTHIYANLNQFHLPPHLTSHQFRLVMNALPTARRRRHMTNTALNQVEACPFCNGARDSIEHFHSSACPTTSSAHNLLFSSLNLKPPHFTLLHSFLGTPIENNLGPPTLCLNVAIWKFHSLAGSTPQELRSSWLPNKIKELALSLLHSFHAHSSRNNPRSTANLAKTANYYLNIIEQIPLDSIVAFTDGSASPNPGPCGAGCCIYLPSPPSIIDMGTPLGWGSNNLAEIYALGMCLLRLHDTPAKPTTIFSDSKYAIDSLLNNKKPHHYATLVHEARTLWHSLSSTRPLQLCWIRGHQNIEGNERADRLASLAMTYSRSLQNPRSFFPSPLFSSISFSHPYPHPIPPPPTASPSIPYLPTNPHFSDTAARKYVCGQT